jgi:hypothetical protein
VRRVRRETTLRLERLLDTRQHVVQRIDQASDLVLRARMRQALRQLRRIDSTRLANDSVDGAEYPAIEEHPRRPERQNQRRTHGDEEDPGRFHNVVHVV